MKMKVFSILLALSLLICTMPIQSANAQDLDTNLGVVEEKASSNFLEAEIYTKGENVVKGNNNIFGIDRNICNSSIDLSELNNNIDLEYKIRTTDIDQNNYKIDMEGVLFVNGKQCKFKASCDDAIKKKLNNEDMLIGVLSGEITIDEKDRKLIISVEKTDNNSYFFFAINSIDSDEGTSMIRFGESMLTEENFKSIFKTEDDDRIIKPQADYIGVDADWEKVTGYEDSPYTVMKGTLYAESDLADGLDDEGRLVTKVQYDSNSVLEVFEDEYDIDDMYVRNITIDYYNIDRESSFGNHYPDETDSSSTIADYIAALLSDLGVPTYGFSILRQMILDSSPGISISNDDNQYERNFRIRLSENTEYMDWYQDHDGGYCVEVYVDNAQNTVRDRIDVDVDMTISMYFSDGNDPYTWGNIFTETVTLEADLADFK